MTQPVLTGTHLHRNATHCKDKENELLSFSRRGSIPRHKEQCERVCIATSAVPVLWLQQCFSTFSPCIPSLWDTAHALSLTQHVRGSLEQPCAPSVLLSEFCTSATKVFLEEFQLQCCCRSSGCIYNPSFLWTSLGYILLSPRCFKHFWAKILYTAKERDNIEIFNYFKHHSSIEETIMPFTYTFSSSFNRTFKPKGTCCPPAESCNHTVP